MPVDTIQIRTSDKIVWNREQIVADTAYSMSQQHDIVFDLFNEGPCWESLEIEPLVLAMAKKFQYDLEKITVLSSNLVKAQSQFRFQFTGVQHLVQMAKTNWFPKYQKNQELKHFALFIRRSNAPRMYLANYLDQRHWDQTCLSYHFKNHINFHRDNIGLEDLYRDFNIENLTDYARFLSTCPRLIEGNELVDLDNVKCTNDFLAADRELLIDQYKKFFVEIVCETCYSGRAFFPTEKIWRPIMMKVPFIVQGPQNFLQNLRTLGFKTFDQWWDEGYSEDPTSYQITAITDIIEGISKKSNQDLHLMYQEMQPILQHNLDVFNSLTAEKFSKLYEQQQ